MTSYMLNTMARMALEIYVELAEEVGHAAEPSAAEIRIAEVIGYAYVENRIGRKLPDMPKVVDEWKSMTQNAQICNLATVVQTGLDCMRVSQYQQIGIDFDEELLAFVVASLDIHNLDPKGFAGPRAAFLFQHMVDYSMSALVRAVASLHFSKLPATFILPFLKALEEISNGQVAVKRIYDKEQYIKVH